MNKYDAQQIANIIEELITAKIAAENKTTSLFENARDKTAVVATRQKLVDLLEYIAHE